MTSRRNVRYTKYVDDCTISGYALQGLILNYKSLLTWLASGPKANYMRLNGKKPK